MFAGSADADEQRVAGGRLQDAVDPADMPHRIFEQHQVHRRVDFVVAVQSLKVKGYTPTINSLISLSTFRSRIFLSIRPKMPNDRSRNQSTKIAIHHEINYAGDTNVHR